MGRRQKQTALLIASLAMVACGVERSDTPPPPPPPPPATVPAPTAVPEPTEEAEPEPTEESRLELANLTDEEAEERAIELTQHGEDAAVIAVLEGRASSPRSRSLLIEAYRARGDRESARREMQAYVERYPNNPRARQYSQILAHP